MPDVLLPVPHFEQSDYGYCLPACARMVLAHQNRQMSERELAEILVRNHSAHRFRTLTGWRHFHARSLTVRFLKRN